MGQIKIGQQLYADTPSPGYITLYMDQTTGLPYWKDADGNATALVQAVTTTGGLASISDAIAPSTTNETQVLGAMIPAGSMNVGTTYRFTLVGQCTIGVVGNITFRIRVGSVSLRGNVIASIVNAPVGSTAAGFSVSGLVTAYYPGSNGTIGGMMTQINSGVTGINVLPIVMSPTNAGDVPAPAAVNTTIENILEFTVQTAALSALPTFYAGVLEAVM